MSGIPVAQDADPNSVPWGQMLPTKIEANLPPYPTEMKPKDGGNNFPKNYFYLF